MRVRLSYHKERLRDILRGFARLSPRAKPPTSRITCAETYNERVQFERNLGANNGLENDDADPMDVDEAGVIYEGSLTLQQSVDRDIADVDAQRTRMIGEIHQQLIEAQAVGSQERIWYLEEQLDWLTNAM